MNSPPTRKMHRKRISALRLSSDSTVPTLPVYTSPNWQQRQVVLVDDPTDLPPEYPDSAEEADEDTDEDEDPQILYTRSTPLLPLTSPPRRPRRLLGPSSSRSKSRRSASTDPYLDSLLARSVHALEMSNVLLQSTMSTQATLNSVFAGGSGGDDASLEAHARNLSSRITKESKWEADLDQISAGLDGLLQDKGGESSRLYEDSAISQSLPASSSMSTVAERIARTHRRRPSLDMRNASLTLSSHDRNDLIAPPPRAITMYIDSTDDPSSITLPPTLGLRSSRPVPTPLPLDSFSNKRPFLIHAVGSESDLPKRAVDILSSVVSPPVDATRSRSSSTSLHSSPSSSLGKRRGSSSTSTSTATRRPRQGASPRLGPTPRSQSQDSANRSPSSVRRIWDNPPIVELPSASSSSSSDDLHVDRTVSYLRNILENNPISAEKQKEKDAAKPAFLRPPPVVPIADASNATASVSRLFTKSRHSSSTRPPSPPRHSALKGTRGRSAPPTPTSPALSLSSSWLSVSDAIGISNSGRSTPNRVSFIEPPESGTRGKDKSSLRSHSSRSRSRRRGKGRMGDSDSSDGPSGWWGWLIGPSTLSGTNVPSYVRQEERPVRGAAWSARNSGFGSGGMEEWGV
ncbi:hypothetical protein PHLGIDRAFT_33896 [Phlebiopsis gigantea 11061_1 CR5-6]|uniref:Uncharacterized protein n=1 Tax=Phlebiopsis gigantea (strain 11061_1 CR5-6) TaxID=745531 RepID=A0A0C3SBV2_PHLG1|nr:hypothetical protein PHLGIDRAFT_33896 [Phlebiopsis gigantea 11061_1 CR5-6]